jgi:quinol monooxygenase YgiN
MIIASARITPLPEKQQEVLSILRHVQGIMRASAGCIACAIYEECADEPAILYFEQWRSQEELHRHLQSRLYLQILTAMDLASEPPEVHFYEVASCQGMELIAELRGYE